MDVCESNCGTSRRAPWGAAGRDLLLSPSTRYTINSWSRLLNMLLFVVGRIVTSYVATVSSVKRRILLFLCFYFSLFFSSSLFSLWNEEYTVSNAPKMKRTHDTDFQNSRRIPVNCSYVSDILQPHHHSHTRITSLTLVRQRLARSGKPRSALEKQSSEASSREELGSEQDIKGRCTDQEVQNLGMARYRWRNTNKQYQKCFRCAQNGWIFSAAKVKKCAFAEQNLLGRWGGHVISTPRGKSSLGSTFLQS